MNKSGPAFPFSVMTYQPDHPESPRYTTNWHEGMTLRDYFAAKAMQTYMMQEVWNPDTYEIAARSAYRVADAMLKAREQ